MGAGPGMSGAGLALILYAKNKANERAVKAVLSNTIWPVPALPLFLIPW